MRRLSGQDALFVYDELPHEPQHTLKVSVLGSGSSGNATFLATGKTRVLVDAGFSYRELSRRLESVGESIRELDAVADRAERISDMLTIYAIKRAE